MIELYVNGDENIMKKYVSLILILCVLFSALPVANAADSKMPSFITANSEGLYIHGTDIETDNEAWQCWQNKIEEEYRGDLKNGDNSKKMLDVDPTTKYFFLPSGSPSNNAEIYNGFSTAITINNTTINPASTAVVSYTPDTPYSVTVNKTSYTLIFKKSTAEAAIYVNNTDADGKGTDLYKYLCQSKDNSASATAAIINSDGTVDNTAVKKIKGRGNTTWLKEKKPFNVTYKDSVSISGMDKGKKYTLLANYQDGALVRNRLLYDLSDAVGMPYASDSRFVDLYMNGVYYGSYQMCQKIEVGKNDLVSDIDDGAYLNEDGTVAKDFPFLMEIDPSASSDDFNFRAGDNSVTVKAPELSKKDTGYNEVKNYVTEKFETLYNAITVRADRKTLESIMDIDSFTKIYLINELGKNWDSGVSSLYMVYKQDKDGNWKFFASPVWDYDNSLGNCNGIFSTENDKNIYLSPKSWWCSTKSSSGNIMKKIASNTYIREYSSVIWFENFVPALEILNSENINSGEIYSADVYYRILEGTADCNYTRGWFLDTNDQWIADHSKLLNGYYDISTQKYVSDENETIYPISFKGEYDFCIDWLNSRSAWLTSKLKDYYTLNGDANLDNKLDINDATTIQKIVAGYTSTEAQIKRADINEDSIVNVRDATHLQKKLAGLIT